MTLTKKKYKMIIIAAILFVLISAYILLMRALPKEIYVVEGEELSFDTQVPVTEEIDGRETEAFGTITKQTHFSIQCKLFGLIPVREVQATVVDDVSVLPAGVTAGLYIKTNGVLVIDTGVIVNQSGESVEPAVNILKKGDYVLSINGENVTTKEELTEKINEAGTQGKEAELTVIRNDEIISVSTTPVQTNEKDYKLGIWIRDELAGIGTIVYVTEDQEYAILGHAISDVDTGEKVNVSSGDLYEANILNIVSGQAGSPGEIQGNISFVEQNYLGSILSNTNRGVFGVIQNLPKALQPYEKEWMTAAWKQEIQLGKAQIISDVLGTRELYEIEIIDINYNSSNDNKSILLQVTDERLLEKTGGIIQGMSGSPIIQNGKIAGAVTHVFVSDASKGYGIFIEDMLNR